MHHKITSGLTSIGLLPSACRFSWIVAFALIEITVSQENLETSKFVKSVSPSEYKGGFHIALRGSDPKAAKVLLNSSVFEVRFVGKVELPFLEALNNNKFVKSIDFTDIDQNSIPLLAKFQNLEILSVFDNDSFKVEKLGRLKELKEIHLDIAPISLESVRYLKSLPNLRVLTGRCLTLDGEGELADLIVAHEWIQFELPMRANVGNDGKPLEK